MNYNVFTIPIMTLCLGATALTAGAKLRIETSLPAENHHAVAAVADGDRETWFQSSRPPRVGEYLALHLGAPQKLTSVRVLTGRPNGGGRFEEAVLELSADGQSYFSATPLTKGEATWSGNDQAVSSIRVRALKEGTAAIAIREIVLDDEVLRRVAVTLAGEAPFGRLTAKCNFAEVPGEYAVLMRDQLDETAAWFFNFYPKIVAMLEAPTEGLPRELEIRFRNDMQPGVPGYVAGRTMTLSIPHILRNPDDVRGLFIHELTHIVQGYSGPGQRPGWLVEGIAEAARYALSPPDDPWRGAVDRIDPEKLDYRNAYRDTAWFLLWIRAQDNPRLIAKLNHALKEGSYTEESFAAISGKDPDAWLREFRIAKGKQK